MGSGRQKVNGKKRIKLPFQKNTLKKRKSPGEKSGLSGRSLWRTNGRTKTLACPTAIRYRLPPEKGGKTKGKLEFVQGESLA